MEGLFSGLTPQQVMEQERQARSGLNLSLARSADPLTGTMFRGLESASALGRNVADIFGNPIQESAAVTAAKEQEGFRNEIARMMQEGVASGEPREETAKRIQSFLLSRGKVAEAEQMRAQGITESQLASKSTAEVGLKEAQTTAALAAAKASEAAAAREKSINYGVDNESYSKEYYGKDFKDLTPQEAGKVNRAVEAMKKANASITTFIQNPDPTKPINAVMSVFSEPQPVKETIKVGNAATKAMTLLNSDRAFDQTMAEQVIASLFGDSETSKSELARIISSGDLATSVANKFTRFISGQPTELTKEEMKQAVTAVYKHQEKAFNGLTSLGANMLKKAGITDLPTYANSTGAGDLFTQKPSSVVFKKPEEGTRQRPFAIREPTIPEAPSLSENVTDWANMQTLQRNR